MVGGVPERKSAYRLDFWRPAERNAFLDDECEHTVVEPNTLWAGVPGKERRKLGGQDRELILQYARNYLDYVKIYLEESRPAQVRGARGQY